MITTLLLLTLAQNQEPNAETWIRPPRVERIQRRGGRSGPNYAFFEAFPAGGAGTKGVCSTTAPTGAKGETLTFTRASNGTCTKTATGGLATTGIANGDLVVLSSNQPRVEYDANGTLGLLVESASTNGVLRSEEFDNAAWTTDASGATITVTANFATAPDGTSTAERVECQATSGLQLATRYSTAYTAGAVGNPWTCSAFVRGNGTSGTTDLCLYDGDAWTCSACSFVAGSWTRCVVSDAAGASSTTRYCKFGNNSNQNGGVARSAVDLTLWGLDGEEKAYATSYIPTTSATVTRAADDARFLITATLGNFSLAGNYYTPSTTPTMRVHGALLREPDDGANFIGSYQTSGTFRGQFVSTASGAVDFADGAISTTGRAASYFDGTLLGACINSTCTTQAKGLFSLSAFGTALAVRIGAYSTTNGNIDGVATRVCFEPNSFTRCR